MVELVDATLWFAGAAMLALGAAFILIGGLGALRMPNLYTRIHAASLTDSLGPILVLGGLMLHGGLSLETLKLGAILIFMLLTGPTATYALANAALLSGMRPDADEREER